MADYYTHFSAILSLSPEQAQWALGLDGAVKSIVTSLYDCCTPGNLDVFEKAASTEKQYPEALAVAEAIEDVGADVCMEAVEEGLWLYTDGGCGSPDYVILFVQTVFTRFGIDTQFRFSWANTCSAPRLDGFGGGAATVTREDSKVVEAFFSPQANEP